MTEEKRTLTTNWKWRGVIHASITRLDGRISELEGKHKSLPADHLSTQRLLTKLNELDTEFKSYHFGIVDLISKGSLNTEQEIVDEHDDQTVSLATCLQQLISKFIPISSSVTESTP